MSFESNKNFENKSLRQLESEKILAESNKNKDILKENISQTIINKLISTEGYTVRNKDVLSLINKITSKGNHINFNNEGDKIWPSDTIKIISGKVLRSHNGKDEIVGVVTEGFENKKTKVISKNTKTEEKILKLGKKDEKIAKLVRKELDGIKKEASEKKDPKIKETKILEVKTKIETINTISNYFNIDIKLLNTQIESNGLNIDLVQFLSEYKNYIENNLLGLDKTILGKIKISIGRKIQELSKIVQKRIEWVDEQIEEGDYDKSDRQKEIQNQRWIINSNLNDLFSEINNKVLPSAAVLANKLNSSKINTNPYGTTGIIFNELEINEMFNSDLTDDGEFDKTWKSGELIDANTNSWSVINATDEEHVTFLKKNNIQTVEGVSLLNEKDKEVESEAKLYWYGALAGLIANDLATFTGVWTVPGAIIGIGYDGADALSDEDTGLLLLKKAGFVNKDYKMEKDWMDNALATIGIIPLMTAVTKSAKLASYINKLSPSELIKFNKIKDKISNLIKNKFKNGKITDDYVEGVELKGNPKNLEKIEIKVQETISDEVWAKYIKNNDVPDDLIGKLAEKYMKNPDSLSAKESEIYFNNTKKVHDYFKAKAVKGAETINKGKENGYNITKSINNDLKTLKKGESLDYPNGLKVEKTANGEYKVGNSNYSNLKDVIKKVEKEISSNYHELIIKGGGKEFSIIREKLKGKEFGEGDNIFKIDNEGKLLKKSNDGGFSEIEINKLLTKEQNIITKTLLGEKGYTTLNKTGDILGDINAGLHKLSDKSSVKFVLDTLSKEAQFNGKIGNISNIVLNIARLPAVNLRKISELWIKSDSGKFKFAPDDKLGIKIWDSIKILFTSSSKPFDTKISTLGTVATVSTVLYLTHIEVQKENPNTPFETTWRYTLEFVKNMNFQLPLEVWDMFLTEKEDAKITP